MASHTMNFKSSVLKCLRPLGVIFILAIAPAYAVAATSLAPDLSQYQWKNRVLLIAAPNQENTKYRNQAAALMSVYPGLLERDLIVLTHFGEAAFSVTLIGKDGGVKLQRDKLLRSAELFAVIDAMPMRRAEIHSERD
jgi:hypothetical protein